MSEYRKAIQLCLQARIPPSTFRLGVSIIERAAVSGGGRPERGSAIRSRYPRRLRIHLVRLRRIGLLHYAARTGRVYLHVPLLGGLDAPAAARQTAAQPPNHLQMAFEELPDWTATETRTDIDLQEFVELNQALLSRPELGIEAATAALVARKVNPLRLFEIAVQWQEDYEKGTVKSPGALLHRLSRPDAWPGAIIPDRMKHLSLFQEFNSNYQRYENWFTPGREQ